MGRHYTPSPHGGEGRGEGQRRRAERSTPRPATPHPTLSPRERAFHFTPVMLDLIRPNTSSGNAVKTINSRFVLLACSSFLLSCGNGSSRQAHDSNSEQTMLTQDYMVCLKGEALKIDDGKESASAIVDAAEARCLSFWNKLQASAKSKARQIVLDANGDDRVARKMINQFDQALLDLKLIARNNTIADVLETRKTNAPNQ